MVGTLQCFFGVFVGIEQMFVTIACVCNCFIIFEYICHNQPRKGQLPV